MSELETGTKPSKYTLATRETLIDMCDRKDAEISDWKKTTIKMANLGLETMDEKDVLVIENAKYEKALEEIQDISFRMNGHMWEED